MLDTTLKSRDEAVSPIVGALLLVAITTSLIPGLILMLDDPDPIPPDAEASWVGIRENDTAPIRHYKVEINALYGAGPNETATIVVDDVSFRAEISMGSTIRVPCVGADPEAAIAVGEHVVTWSAMPACGHPRPGGNGSGGGSGSGVAPEPDREGCRSRVEPVVIVDATGQDKTVVVGVVICDPPRVLSS